MLSLVVIWKMFAAIINSTLKIMNAIANSIEVEKEGEENNNPQHEKHAAVWSIVMGLQLPSSM